MLTSVADPYHFDTVRIRIQDVKKFVTDPDPGRILIRIRIQQKRIEYQENLLFSVFNGFCWIRNQPFFYTDPDPGK